MFTIFLLIIIIDALIQYYTGKNILGYEISKTNFKFLEMNLSWVVIIRVIPIFSILLMNNNVREDNLSLSYSTIISLLCSIVFVWRKDFIFFINFIFFCLILFSNHLRKFVFLTLTLTLIFSLIFPKFQLNDELNPSKRMFTKTFNQIIGDGKNTEIIKEKFLTKSIFFRMTTRHYLLAYKIFKDHPILGLCKRF